MAQCDPIKPMLAVEQGFVLVPILFILALAELMLWLLAMTSANQLRQNQDFFQAQQSYLFVYKTLSAIEANFTPLLKQPCLVSEQGINHYYLNSWDWWQQQPCQLQVAALKVHYQIEALAKLAELALTPYRVTAAFTVEKNKLHCYLQKTIFRTEGLSSTLQLNMDPPRFYCTVSN